MKEEVNLVTAEIVTVTPDNVLPIPDIHRYPPTSQCLVCGCLENPEAGLVDTGKAWLCAGCREVLLEIVESKRTGRRANR